MAVTLPYIGLEEVTKDKTGLVKAAVAEFLGTMFLVLIGCGSCMAGDDDDSLSQQAQYVRIALCFGVTVATLAQSLGHVSGCHVNPAVTAGLVTGAKVGLVKGLVYVAAQSAGAVVGAALLRGLVPADSIRGAAGLGCTGLNSALSAGQGLAIEFLITSVLVLVVFAAAADSNNAASVKGSAPLAIGLSITVCHLFAIPLTGSSMNPARSLGPAVVAGCWAHHWVYWAGPLGGGVAAALLYQLVLRAPEKSEYSGVARDDKP